MRVLRGVGSGLLACGCFVGLYETYRGPTVQIIEERGAVCANPQHRPGVQQPYAPDRHPVSPATPPRACSAA